MATPHISSTVEFIIASLVLFIMEYLVKVTAFNFFLFAFYGPGSPFIFVFLHIFLVAFLDD